MQTIGQAGPVTHDHAPRYKVVRTSLKSPDWENAETILPEGPDSIISLTGTRDYLFIVKSDGITGRIVRYQLATGQATELALPAAGTIHMSCPDRNGNHCFVSISCWIRPSILYDLDGAKGSFSLSSFNTNATYPGFENLVAEEVQAPGHDGTLIPLSIIHRRDLPLDGSSNCILTGYGLSPVKWCSKSGQRSAAVPV
jgi:prolyl oligopeptidase